MPSSRAARFRAALHAIHRWIALAFLILLLPIAVSGTLLVWHDALDVVLNPHRYAVSSAGTLPPSRYLASAATVSDDGLQAAAIRYSHEPGGPIIVMVRGTPGSGAPPRFFNIFLDPATAKVLDKVDFRSSLFGFLHVFHENLTVPQYSGRAIVGWTGVAMLILSLSGIYLWWPANGAFIRGLRYRRSSELTTNLHHFLGFWISVPLAIVSLTGIYLSFPPQARSFMASIAPMAQAQRPNFASRIVTDSALGADRALALAAAAEPNMTPVTIFLPVALNSQRGAGDAAPVWRIQMRAHDSADTTTLLIDDRTGATNRLPPPLAGDRAALWIRWIHDGSRGGVLWQFVVFLTGVFPVVFGITGVIMWWRARKRRLAQTARAAPQMRPAE